MPAEKTYEPADVLDRATLAFWQKGYEGTSMADLVAATRIGRGSLYTAYKGKEELFLACLAHYDKKHRADFLVDVARDRPPLKAILATFQAAARPQSETGLPPGCLLVNTALEVSPHNARVQALVNESLHRLELFFRDLLKAALADGTAPEGLDPETTARSLLGLFLGLRVMVRSGLNGAAADAVLDQVSEMLR